MFDIIFTGSAARRAYFWSLLLSILALALLWGPLVPFMPVAAKSDATATIGVRSDDSDSTEELPGPVVGLELTATYASVTASWRTPESGGAPRCYIAHVKRQGGGDGQTKRTGPDNTTVTSRDLKGGATYKVWVRAQNGAGKGERVQATIKLLVELPGPVVGLELTATTDTVTVSWQRPETGSARWVHRAPQT